MEAIFCVGRSSLSSNQSQHLLYEATNQTLTSNDLDNRESKLRITGMQLGINPPFTPNIRGSSFYSSIPASSHRHCLTFVGWRRRRCVCLLYFQAGYQPPARSPASCGGLLYVGPSKYSAGLFLCMGLFFDLDYLSSPSSHLQFYESDRTAV